MTDPGPASGRALRDRWDTACADALAIVDAAIAQAGARGDEGVRRHLRTGRTALESLRRSVDARRSLPGTRAPGLLAPDIPADLGRPPYADALDALGRVQRLFEEGLHEPGWQWSRDGFPPDWPSSAADRLRAGLVFRAHRRAEAR